MYKWFICLCLVFLCGCSTDNTVKIGATYMSMSNPYFEEMNNTIKYEIELRNGILITRDPVYNQEKQIEQIEEMIELGIDALILNPVDYDGVKPALEKCKENNIPVFCVDTVVSNPDLIVSSVLSNNYDAGVQCGKDLLNKKKSANIVLIYNQIVKSTNDRVAGFVDTINTNENFKIVEIYPDASVFEESMIAMDSILKSGVEFDTVFSCNDPTALGVIAALQKNNIEDDITIYCVDGSPDGKRFVLADMIEATCAQFPNEMGKITVNEIYKYLNNEEVQKEIIVDVKLTTKRDLLNKVTNNEWY